MATGSAVRFRSRVGADVDWDDRTNARLDRVRSLGRRREESLDGTGDGESAASERLAADSNPVADAEEAEQRSIVLAALAERCPSSNGP